jgi:hypothetical protein
MSDDDKNYRSARGSGDSAKFPSPAFTSKILADAHSSVLGFRLTYTIGEEMKAPNDMYRNLHTETWSLVDRDTGRVAEHPQEALIRDAKFVVQPAGNKRVRDEKKKHVHAFVRGTNTPGQLSDMQADMMSSPNWQRITYNPFKHTTFVLADSETPVAMASEVLLTSDGKAWAKGVTLITEET